MNRLRSLKYIAVETGLDIWCILPARNEYFLFLFEHILRWSTICGWQRAILSYQGSTSVFNSCSLLEHAPPIRRHVAGCMQILMLITATRCALDSSVSRANTTSISVETSPLSKYCRYESYGSNYGCSHEPISESIKVYCSGQMLNFWRQMG